MFGGVHMGVHVYIVSIYKDFNKNFEYMIKSADSQEMLVWAHNFEVTVSA